MPKIVSLSNACAQLLAREGRGEIHSVYRRTVNLRLRGDLIALQAAGTVSGPLSLETDCTEQELASLGLCGGMEAKLSPRGVVVNGVGFDASEGTVWNARLAEALPPSADTDLAFLTDCLRGILPKGGFSDLTLPEGERWRSEPSAVAAEPILRVSRRHIADGQWALGAEALSGLLGLGEGLTPSGDDFLCGVLAACELVGTDAALALSGALKEGLTGRLGETNDISAGFLRCAVKGLFSRPVIALAQGVSREAACRSFGAIGHSSGADTLNGMIFLFTLLGDQTGGT